MLRLGDEIEGRYEILEPLGQGGMGKVWKASDKKINPSSFVAIKEFEPQADFKLSEEQKQNLREGFLKEAELLAGLEHEAFPKVRDYVIYRETPCIVMDYVSGKEFTTLLSERNNKPLEISYLYDWLEQLLDALDYLHSNLVIHKDIKPENLKLTQNGKIKVLDFGIAKGAIGEMTIPQRSIALGTLQYAPLEQALKACPAEFRTNLLKLHQNKVEEFVSKKTCHQTDIFALCATIYRLFAKMLPEYNSINRAFCVWNNEPDPLPFLHEINPKIPQVLSELIKKGMNLEIEDRIESASAMRSILEEIREGEQKQKENKEREIWLSKEKIKFKEESNLELNRRLVEKEIEWTKKFEEKEEENRRIAQMDEELSDKQAQIIQCNLQLNSRNSEFQTLANENVKLKEEVIRLNRALKSKKNDFDEEREEFKRIINEMGYELFGDFDDKVIIIPSKITNSSKLVYFDGFNENISNNFKIDSATVSDRGLSEKRPQNEDSFLEIAERGIFAVADGVGGAKTGEFASSMAMEILGEAFVNTGENNDAEEVMILAIKHANSAIYQMSCEVPQLTMMKTTIVALHIDGNIATIGHVGDSRLYRLDGSGNLYRETQDHTLIEEEVIAGRMTPAQAANHPSRNVISRALGAIPTVEIDMKTIMFESQTSFLLCSSGITRHIDDFEIRQLLMTDETPTAICSELKRICYERGAEDNLTAIIVRIAKSN